MIPLAQQNPHRRFNPLKREWVLVSPHRTQRPWQGQTETKTPEVAPVTKVETLTEETSAIVATGQHSDAGHPSKAGLGIASDVKADEGGPERDIVAAQVEDRAVEAMVAEGAPAVDMVSTDPTLLPQVVDDSSGPTEGRTPESAVENDNQRALPEETAVQKARATRIGNDQDLGQPVEIAGLGPSAQVL